MVAETHSLVCRAACQVFAKFVMVCSVKLFTFKIVEVKELEFHSLR